MSHRVNFIINDDNWQHLSAVPRGERSRWVNQALAEYRRVQNRRAAADRMDAISRSLPAVVGHADDWVRGDRERDG
jgi:hypothetical protein